MVAISDGIERDELCLAKRSKGIGFRSGLAQATSWAKKQTTKNADMPLRVRPRGGVRPWGKVCPRLFVLLFKRLEFWPKIKRRGRRDVFPRPFPIPRFGVRPRFKCVER